MKNLFYITKGQKQSPLTDNQWDAIMRAYQGMMDRTDDLDGKKGEKAVDNFEKGLKKICGKDARSGKKSFVLRCPEDLTNFVRKNKDKEDLMVYYDGFVLRLRDFLNDQILSMATSKESSRKYYISQARQYHLG